MKKIAIIVAAIALIAACVFWMLLHRRAGNEEQAGDHDAAEKQSVVHVKVEKIKRKSISEKVMAYGSVIGQPAKVHSFSVAFECRVRHILVAPGESVREGQDLVELEPSPAAQLQMRQAKNVADASERDLKQTQARFNLKLATNQELGLAQKAARDAELQMESMLKLGTGAETLKANTGGIVEKVDAQNGQIVAVGGPLVEIVAEDEIEVKLGVEAADLAGMAEGQVVTLLRVNYPAVGELEGHVRLVTRRIDPSTRLVDVYVSLAPGTRLLLDGYVRGEISRTSANALVVPATALLPEEQGFSLFTVKSGVAEKRIVTKGVENGDEVEVISPKVQEGEDVVTAGNYELQEGMRVEEGK